MNPDINKPEVFFSVDEISYNLCMLEEMDDEEYLQGMLTLLVTETPQDLNTMLEAVKVADYETVCKKAHVLKSTAGIIQAAGFVNLLNTIEADAKQKTASVNLAGNIQIAIGLFSCIESELQACINKLK